MLRMEYSGGDLGAPAAELGENRPICVDFSVRVCNEHLT